jgi:Cytochrome P460
MRAKFPVVAASLVALGVSLFGVKEHTGAEAQSQDPKFVQGNELVRPEGYREWIYLSSGLGMNYSARSQPDEPQFTNVFVKPEAYRQFIKSGTWPDRTLFVLEERDSSTKGSINKAGHFQTKLAGLVAEVKDESRFPEKWAFFTFTDAQGKLKDTAKVLPKSACWTCHNSNGAVDNTFVQFYPTLKEVAQSKGTFREGNSKEAAQ